MKNKLAQEIKKVANDLDRLGKFKAANMMDYVYRRVVAQDDMGGQPVQESTTQAPMPQPQIPQDAQSFADSINTAVQDQMGAGTADETAPLPSVDGQMSSEVKGQLTTLLQNMYKESLQVEALLFEAKKTDMDPEILREVQAVGTKLKNAINSVVTSIKGGGEEKPAEDKKNGNQTVMTDEQAVSELSNSGS